MPLHFKYSKVFELMEWIELNKILGADKFVIYIYSIANNTAEMLDYYVKEGLVELVQWNLPMKSYTWPKTREPVEIQSNGMIVGIQDCLLRNKAQSEFIVNIDADEFIIPRVNNVITWYEMMKHVAPYYDTYIFRNVFFRKDWNSDWNKTRVSYHGHDLARDLVTLRTIFRENIIYERMSRSKYFTRTTKVEKVLMIHTVRGGRTYTAPLTTALLHHYRNWENPNKPLTRIRDDLMVTKYGDTLKTNVDRMWNKIKKF